ncbi:MAG: type II toxin-antitoxin system death-on-curing family toxin [bacterium]
MTPAIAKEPVWITRQLLDAMQHALVEQYGGMHGVRDDGLIESALARPKNAIGYLPESSLAALAASLCFGIAKNHGYLDGNKRTAFTAAAVFLRLNGMPFVVPEADVVTAMVFLASNQWDEIRLAEWFSGGRG